MKVLIRKSLIFILCGGALIVQPHTALAALSNPLDPIIAAAKKEGSVTLGLTLMEKSHGKPAGELYLAAFQKRHPFLKVNFNAKTFTGEKCGYFVSGMDHDAGSTEPY